MVIKNSTLVLFIDRDNNIIRKIGDKLKVNSPIIGEVNNLNVAIELGKNDPKNPDIAAIFAAIQTHKSIKNSEIATITGHQNIGIKSDSIIANQADQLINKLKPDQAIIIINDDDDCEYILPIIQSRIRIRALQMMGEKSRDYYHKRDFFYSHIEIFRRIIRTYKTYLIWLSSLIVSTYCFFLLYFLYQNPLTSLGFSVTIFFAIPLLYSNVTKLIRKKRYIIDYICYDKIVEYISLLDRLMHDWVKVRIIPDDESKKLTFKCEICAYPYDCDHTKYLHSRVTYESFINKDIKKDDITGEDVEDACNMMMPDNENNQ